MPLQKINTEAKKKRKKISYSKATHHRLRDFSWRPRNSRFSFWVES